MPRFMKMLNNISRSQSGYRVKRLESEGLSAAHMPFILSICRAPGRSQEEIAQDLCLDKSTVARALVRLEENGFVRRVSSQADRRRLTVEPTKRALEVLPKIKAVSSEWQELLTDGIDAAELDAFYSVLVKMESRAKAIAGEVSDLT